MTHLALLCLLAQSPGSLLIVGGGAVGPEIWQAFAEAAGGYDAPIVYVPTADEREPGPTATALFTRAGFKNVTVLHTRNRDEANTESFVAPLRSARAVWFGGGRQWRLVDSYLGTLAEREFRAVLSRGGVIGGTSAGATIQGSYLVRGARSGNNIMMAPGYEQGFAYLDNVAIDQHLLKRNRENDLWSVIDKHPHLLGIGIDESTAILVRENTFTVLGASKVAIYRHAHRPHLFLSPGDRFHLPSRQPVSP